MQFLTAAQTLASQLTPRPGLLESLVQESLFTAILPRDISGVILKLTNIYTSPNQICSCAPSSTRGDKNAILLTVTAAAWEVYLLQHCNAS